jgi:hypothetical protein
MRWILLFASLFVLASILLVTIGRSTIDGLIAEPADVGTPVALDSVLTEDEQRFYDAVVPRMLVVSAESEALAILGRERSRDLLEIQVRGDRVTQNANQIADFVAENGVPARFAADYDKFARGVVLLRSAMENSFAAMMEFDWDQIGDEIAAFEEGAALVNEATNRMQQLAQKVNATPER